MDIQPTELDGVLRLRQVRHGDERGWFTRTWCAREMRDAGAEARTAQVNLSHTSAQGTVRGIHRQVGPHAEAKTVWVLAGAIWDVAVDLRDGSPTFGRHIAAELSAVGGTGLHVPAGFGHGFQALADEVTVLYVMSEFHAPDAEEGVHHADERLAIPWPQPITVVSDKDRALPRLGGGHGADRAGPAGG